MIETMGIMSVRLCRVKAISTGEIVFFESTEMIAHETPKRNTTKSILIPSHL